MAQLSSRLRSGSWLGLLAAPLALMAACGDDVVNHYYTNNYYTEGGAPPANQAGAGGDPSSVPSAGGGGDGGDPGGAGMAGAVTDAGAAGAAGGSGIDPRYPDAPLADTAVDQLPLDLFGVIGNRFWFAVSDEQRTLMNSGSDGGGICCFEDGLYRPGATSKANWVDHLFVTTAGPNPKTADYGKVQARVVGQYSRFPWDERNIPNLNIDADEFIEGQRIADYEHLRFSNGQRGSIFRDKLAYDLYRMLDYPAPLTTFAWVQSNVWGPDVSIPYILVERYKRKFCDRNATQFGGGCPNMWEFVGDFGYGGGGGGGKGVPIPLDAARIGSSLFDDPDNCQVGKCDSTRVKELEAKIAETPLGQGFQAALADYIDWTAFHRFQCLSWVLATSDDTIHAGNNVVLVERKDGLFQYLPYSIDLSMGSWGKIPLHGSSVLAQGCQADTTCWAETLDVCEDVINDLVDAKPREYLASLYADLETEGMLRPGDDDNFRGIDDYFAERLESLPTELEQYRSGQYCEYPYVLCGDQCVYEHQCYCPAPPGGVGGAPGGMGGAAAIGGGAAMGNVAVGGGVSAGGSASVGGNVGAAGDVGVGGDGAGGGNGCVITQFYALKP